MDSWAKAPLARDQVLLFSPTLDDSISENHPVRLLDEILRAQDWSAWRQEYDGRRRAALAVNKSVWNLAKGDL